MTEWHRVNRNHPCEICNHIDWCTFTDDGTCCMRIESPRSMHNGGWFHLSGSVGHRRYTVTDKSTAALPAQDFAVLISRWQESGHEKLESYAALLGVSQQALDWLDVCWAPEYRAWAWPMHSPGGEIVGVRLRGDTMKWSVKGSHNGLFLSFKAKLPMDTVLICEGASDCATGLTLGFFTIGRPSNLTGNEMIAEVLNQLPAKDVIVVFDNDEHVDSMGQRIRPGPFGAERLIKCLKHRVTRFVPPTKDLRSFIQSGGTRALIESIIATTVRT